MPGAICLSGDAYHQVCGKIDADFIDLGDKKLKNIGRALRVYSLETGGTKAKPLQWAERNVRVSAIAGAAALILAGGGAAWYFGHGSKFDARTGAELTAAQPAMSEAAKSTAPESSKPAAAHLSIVVLPFANLSGDPSQDYFVEGVTDNLITDLARIKGSFVIARNTAFTYKGKNINAKEIGKELGVRYVLEGSVQRDQGRVRVPAYRRRNGRASLGGTF
jgi:TolB-like protein